MKKFVLFLALFFVITASVDARPSSAMLKKLSRLQRQYSKYDAEYTSMCHKYPVERNAVSKEFAIAKNYYYSSNTSKRSRGKGMMNNALRSVKNFYGSQGLLWKRVNLCIAWEKVGKKIDDLYRNRKNGLRGKIIWENKATRAKKSAMGERSRFIGWYELQFSKVFRKRIKLR